MTQRKLITMDGSSSWIRELPLYSLILCWRREIVFIACWEHDESNNLQSCPSGSIRVIESLIAVCCWVVEWLWRDRMQSLALFPLFCAVTRTGLKAIVDCRSFWLILCRRRHIMSIVCLIHNGSRWYSIVLVEWLWRVRMQSLAQLPLSWYSDANWKRTS